MDKWLKKVNEANKLITDLSKGTITTDEFDEQLSEETRKDL